VSNSRAIPPEKLKLLLWLSTSVILLAAVVFVFTVGDGWSWPLFLWGASLGPVGVLASKGTELLGKRYLCPSPEEIQRNEALRRDVIRPARWYTMFMGVPLGAMAASTGSAALDVLLTVGLVLVTLLPLAILPSLKRKAARATGPPPADMRPSGRRESPR
jgi:hypothetical protein